MPKYVKNVICLKVGVSLQTTVTNAIGSTPIRKVTRVARQGFAKKANPFGVVGSKPTPFFLRPLSTSHHGIFMMTSASTMNNLPL